MLRLDPDLGRATVAVRREVDSLCKTTGVAIHPAALKLCVWNGLIGLVQAAAVNKSSNTPTTRNKATDLLLPVLLLVLLVAFPVAVWWVHRRATHRIVERGILAPRTPSQYRPLSIPSPIHLAARAPYVIFDMANALTTISINIVTTRPRSRWTQPEIVLAGLSVILTVIGLVLAGLALLYAQRAVPRP